MKHVVFSPIEAPAFELDLVMRVRFVGLPGSVVCSGFAGETIPKEFRKACAPKSIRVAAVTAVDKPCRLMAEVDGDMVRAWAATGTIWPSEAWVHLVGIARNSPPAWERHSRQQFMRNRRAFSKALP